jgi:hypothetical protein
MLAIGNGEDVPWKDLDNSCPDCGGNELPLETSKGDLKLTFIHCPMCDGMWLRGPLILSGLRQQENDR